MSLDLSRFSVRHRVGDVVKEYTSEDKEFWTMLNNASVFGSVVADKILGDKKIQEDKEDKKVVEDKKVTKSKKPPEEEKNKKKKKGL